MTKKEIEQLIESFMIGEEAEVTNQKRFICLIKLSNGNSISGSVFATNEYESIIKNYNTCLNQGIIEIVEEIFCEEHQESP